MVEKVERNFIDNSCRIHRNIIVSTNTSRFLNVAKNKSRKSFAHFQIYVRTITHPLIYLSATKSIISSLNPHKIPKVVPNIIFNSGITEQMFHILSVLFTAITSRRGLDTKSLQGTIKRAENYNVIRKIQVSNNWTPQRSLKMLPLLFKYQGIEIFGEGFSSDDTLKNITKSSFIPINAKDLVFGEFGGMSWSLLVVGCVSGVGVVWDCMNASEGVEGAAALFLFMIFVLTTHSQRFSA